MRTFATCVTEEEPAEQLNEDADWARVLGVRGTPALVVLTLLVCASPVTVRAQSIRGRVIDATRSGPVVNAEVRVVGRAGFAASLLTDSGGRFSFRLPEKGRYVLRATSLGYVPSDSAVVDVEQSWQQVEVIIRLATSPIEIAGISVVARGLELRHRATFPGFLERHQSALRVGPARVVAKGDPVMQSAFNIGDLLKWFPKRRGCTVVYVDGKVNPGWSDAERVAVLDIAGIEFYRDVYDAPLEFRGGGPPCLRTIRYSILVVWRDPLPSARESHSVSSGPGKIDREEDNAVVRHSVAGR